MNSLNDQQLAARLALDIPDGAYVNLGIGKPTHVSSYVPSDREVLYHSENGIIGVGPTPAEGEEDPEMIDASKRLITLAPGAAFFCLALRCDMQGSREWLMVAHWLVAVADGDGGL